jgi:hypothetical protein
MKDDMLIGARPMTRWTAATTQPLRDGQSVASIRADVW